MANKSNLVILNRSYETVGVMHGVLDTNTHSIAMVGPSMMAAAMTSSDSVKFLDLSDARDHKLFSIRSNRLVHALDGEDTHHVNSIVPRGHCLLVMLHNRGRPSQVATIDLHDGCIVALATINARKAHGLAVFPDGSAATLDTEGQRDLLEFDLRTGKTLNRTPLGVPPERFLRGMVAVDRSLFLVSHFDRADRSFRGSGDSVISLVRDGRIDGRFVLEGIGAVNEMRRLDGIDYANAITQDLG